MTSVASSTTGLPAESNREQLDHGLLQSALAASVVALLFPGETWLQQRGQLPVPTADVVCTMRGAAPVAGDVWQLFKSEFYMPSEVVTRLRKRSTVDVADTESVLHASQFVSQCAVPPSLAIACQHAATPPLCVHALPPQLPPYLHQMLDHLCFLCWLRTHGYRIIFRLPGVHFTETAIWYIAQRE